MSNTILSPTAVTREALRILHQKLNFVGSINRQYDDQFAKSGAQKIGESLKIRLPNQYTVRTGKTLNVQPTTESSVTLTVATQKGVDMDFSSAELSMSLDKFSERVIDPAVNVLAAAVEADALSMRKDVYNQVNNTAAAATFAGIVQGRRKLVDNLTPSGNRTALLNTTDNASLADALKGLFQDSEAIKKQYREGQMGRTGGFDFFESTHLNTQERGSGANYVVNGANQSGAAVTIGTGTGTIKRGEIVHFVGCTRVHPETKEDTGILQQFVVTADLAAAGDLAISPAIVLTGPGQNVAAAPTDTGNVVIVGTASTPYGQSLLYHKDAFTFVTADLVMPKGVDFAARQVLDGISLRVVRQYDINNDQFPCRLDVYYGYKTIRPQLACRVANLAPA